MSVAPSVTPLPDDIRRFLMGASSTASIPLAIGVPAGAPGELLIGGRGVGKINDQAIIKSTPEPAIIRQGHPRILAYGRPVSGKGYEAEGTQTGAKGGVDESDTAGCVLMTAEATTKCAVDVASSQADIMDDLTKSEQAKTQDALSRSQKKFNRQAKTLEGAKKPATIERLQQSQGDIKANIDRHSGKMRGFKAMKRVAYADKVFAGAEAVKTMLDCRPAAAMGGFGKSFASSVIGGAFGSAVAGTCAVGTAGVGTIVCVGGGIAAGAGAAEVTESVVDWGADKIGLDSLGKWIDEYAQQACDALL
ncbi:MAG: hypothetical protein KJZ65_13565 [Phycisphaerales bacterium]|nr:hypothetical protein [Phycisphaerales bacterium]